MGLMNAFNIGREGLTVHGKRVEIAAKNIANIKKYLVKHLVI